MSEGQQTFRELRRLLAELLGRHGDEQATVDQINGLLDVLEAKLAYHERPVKRRRGEDTTYKVEPISQRPMLAEYRSTGRPLRVERALFDGVVTALSDATRPLAAEDILETTGQTTGERLVEWQVRVVLRFLLRADPAILRRNRSKYHPVDQKSFSKAAAALWHSVAEG